MTPPLPSLRALTAELRDLHEAWSHPHAGGEYVSLHQREHDYRVGVSCTYTGHEFGREYVPGSVEAPCDCRGGWRVTREEEGGPESCRRCGGTGRVHAPSSFDATAAARRLLAAARDGMTTQRTT